ncbi:MAG: Hsp20/alpha crystallin family protein [Thermoplasmata archaeon]|nr:MAG: Hsp20/alpha crystallin family protein [Thermoplasmata archaeon]KAA0014096.1 MAG: Hsp20/alpha crystallin family protein [Thermoplasmata archaeon]OYT61514.1 MAG: molecular chaperone Hsp20 [Thermoplasmatales archaeon ex4484_30]
MVGRKDKRRDKDPFDWFEDWPSWGFEDIFEEFDERFRKMQQHMNRVIREAMEGKLPSPKEGGPFIYGWSFRVGPDGKPHFTEFGNIRPRAGIQEEAIREPLVDVIESDDKVSVTAEVPGVAKEDIQLEVAEDTLTIKVDTKDRKYYKEVKLPCEVDEKSAKATYQNGVLDVEFKKLKPKKKGKKIKVE